MIPTHPKPCRDWREEEEARCFKCGGVQSLAFLAGRRSLVVSATHTRLALSPTPPSLTAQRASRSSARASWLTAIASGRCLFLSCSAESGKHVHQKTGEIISEKNHVLVLFARKKETRERERETRVSFETDTELIGEARNARPSIEVLTRCKGRCLSSLALAVKRGET